MVSGPNLTRSYYRATRRTGKETVLSLDLLNPKGLLWVIIILEMSSIFNVVESLELMLRVDLPLSYMQLPLSPR